MDRSEFDPERDLQNGPYPRRGFTQQLQQRIEERIERKSRCRRKLGISLAAAAVSAACAIGVFLQWYDPAAESKQAKMAAAVTEQTSASPERAMDNSPSLYNSGLLLGLRTDFQNKSPKSAAVNADSSYRTLFIAPFNGRLDVAAEGKGILLPYGQTFWKIDAVMQSAGDDVYRMLIAHPADRPVPERAMPPRSEGQLRHSERLLFVGNKYVTLEQTEGMQKGKRTLQTSRVWVKEMQQLNGEMAVKTNDATVPGYVGFQAVFGAGANRIDEWAIVRRAGAWVPAVATTTVDDDKMSYSLKPVSLTLPDSVVSHDQLCCTWAEIQRVQPDAVDALSSPMKDFVAIVTRSSIYFNEIKNGKIGDTPQLTINLNKNEKLVMTQWSTGAYVEQWVKASRKFLNQP